MAAGLEKQYLSLTTRQGAALGVAFCNALAQADRLSGHLSWGCLAESRQLQSHVRVLAWSRVETTRAALYDFVTRALGDVVARMKDEVANEAAAERVAMFESDLCVKAWVLGRLAESPSAEATQVLLAVFALAPMVDERRLEHLDRAAARE